MTDDLQLYGLDVLIMLALGFVAMVIYFMHTRGVF